MRATTTSSTESGSALMESPFSTAATSSRTKSGFPPERSTRSSISRRGRGFSCVASKASAAASVVTERTELHAGDGGVLGGHEA